RRRDSGDRDAARERGQGAAVRRAEVDLDDAIPVPAEAEEKSLAERKQAAIAPHDAKAERHENPCEEIGYVADVVRIGKQRIDQRCHEHDQRPDPERPTVAERLRAVEKTAHGRSYEERRASQPENPSGSTRMMRITAISSPIWPTIW